jgi:signal transduction histidine kinase
MYTASREALNSREQVLAVVSHDFRNALAAIAASARMLQDGVGDATARGKRLETIVRVCDRTLRLVHDLLDVTRLQAGKGLSVSPVELDIRPLLQEACEIAQAQSERKGVSLRCELPDSLPRVRADYPRLLQVMANLIGNAVKFTPEGGSIVVRAEASDGLVQLSIADNGPGIPHADVPFIFERFWQARRTAAMGTGLGLPIARGIVEAHGGKIWVDSQPGAGAVFSFTLPAADTPVA